MLKKNLLRIFLLAVTGCSKSFAEKTLYYQDFFVNLNETKDQLTVKVTNVLCPSPLFLIRQEIKEDASERLLTLEFGFSPKEAEKKVLANQGVEVQFQKGEAKTIYLTIIKAGQNSTQHQRIWTSESAPKFERNADGTPKDGYAPT